MADPGEVERVPLKVVPMFIDEPLLALGRSLKLPPWLEPSREQIEHSVAQITLPEENNPALGAA